MPMEALKAIVKNGRLVLDAPTDLPEGLEVELAIVHDEDDSELLAEERPPKVDLALPATSISGSSPGSSSGRSSRRTRRPTAH